MLHMAALVRLFPEANHNTSHTRALSKVLSDESSRSPAQVRVFFVLLCTESHSLQQQEVLQSLSDFCLRGPLYITKGYFGQF